MTHDVFVDETKSHGYLMAAAAVEARDLAETRSVLRGLLLPGQRRIHFIKERDSRRRSIISALVDRDLRVTVYDASAVTHDLLARAACITAILEDAVVSRATRLVFERADSLELTDRRLLSALMEKYPASSRRPAYELMRCHEEQLLALPDIVAWCWAKGGDWKRRIRPIVCDVRKLP